MSQEKWTKAAVIALHELPFFELIHQAHTSHKKHFDTQEIELCALSSIKTGACPENCGYCPQSGHYKTGVKKEKLINIDEVLNQAKQAKLNGAKRFCMGAAWKNPPKKDFPAVLNMISAVKTLGLETCATLGMLDEEQAALLKGAGLDYYNHNLDTSPNFYSNIVTTRTYADRLETLQHVADADINVCCGGILGMGETRGDRIEFLLALQRLPQPIQSIPINQLIPITGTPLENAKPIEAFEFIRAIAVARLMFPQSRIRLSAGRENMSDMMQAWCFMAGANSVFIGEKLLTAKNASMNDDAALFSTLNMRSTDTQTRDDRVE